MLAAAGFGGVFAVQQGWLQLPELGGLAALLPGLPGPGGAPKPAPKPAKGSCSPAAFDAVIPEWPAGYCGELLRRHVGSRGGEGDGLDPVFQALERQVGEDSGGWNDAARNDARVLQRHQAA